MTEIAPPTFLDVPHLLESSVPRPRAGWLGYGAGGLLLVVLMATLVVAGTEDGRNLARFLSAFAMVGVVIAMAAVATVTVRRFRSQQALVEAAGELVQLRRWPQAGLVLEQILSQPLPTYAMRSQALIYLSSVLARYHRFDDAIKVHEHLLDHEFVDGGAAFGVRVGRAMAMLREDHLFDADRAISELRRAAGEKDSAGLALLELYRDVRTGHSEDAVERFNRTLTVMRDELGHRVADAYALVARAYDLLGRTSEAQDAFAKATLLAPPPELYRRYPEVQKLDGRYRPAYAPPEAA